ncbi:MAG: 50S ribosomal protein L11 methyltransferase [Verrucomicrobiae bacterium]|jgi:ribosomal protein L11 methyltransferase|nr:50S ribosomal protein L11 methyltransferase [Verrucomicrobiae bacterium]
MKPQSVYQLSVVTSLEAEYAVTEMLAAVLDRDVSSYLDFERRISVVSSYFEKSRKPTRKLLAAVQAGLAEVGTTGVDPGAAEVHVKLLRGADWMESWKKHFVPLDISGRLLIKPSWEKRRPKKGQHEIILDPGISFGTGHHATTSFCLHQLVEFRRSEAGQTFIDIGCGSGILGIAAAKLGYGPVVSFDYNADSIRSARENAERNGVSDRVRPTVKDLTRLPVDTSRKYDIVCANLIYDLLIAERERIANRLKPDGLLVLAGILETQFPKVTRAFREIGFKPVVSKVEGEWKSGSFRRG